MGGIDPGGKVIGQGQAFQKTFFRWFCVSFDGHMRGVARELVAIDSLSVVAYRFLEP